MEGMEKHLLALKQICRICANKIETHEKQYSKQHFYTEVGSLYGIELNQDSDSLHPQNICAKDAAVLYRARAAITEKKNFSTKLVPFAFSEHSNDCYICNTIYKEKKKAGRPRKTKQFPVGVIHLQTSDSVSQGFTESVNAQDIMDTSEYKYNCNHLIPEYECFICVSVMMSNTLKFRTEEEKFNVLSCFLEKLDQSDITLFSYLLGKSQTLNIKHDARQFGLLYKDVDALSQLDLKKWLIERNNVVKQFLYGVSGKERNIEQSTNDNAMVGLTTAVEQVYKLCDDRLISPFAFLQNLCIYSLTGSRKTVDLTGKTKPSGCYSSVVKWLLEQSSREPVVADGDLINVFDNEQVIGFKSAIKPKHKAKVSVITNKGYLNFDPTGKLQTDQALKPPPILKLNELDQGKYFVSKEDFSETVKGMITVNSEMYDDYRTLHYEQLYYFVESAINAVAEDQKIKDGTIVDVVDETIKETQTEEQFITCLCGKKNPRRKIVCTGCNSREGIKVARSTEKNNSAEPESSKQTAFCKIQFETTQNSTIDIKSTYDIESSERYEHIISNHRGKKEVVLTDPVFCNPNSCETVAYVLRQIGIENGLTRYGGSCRHWTFICCDGVPYMICKKLKEDAVICLTANCKESFLSKKDYDRHVESVHSDVSECKYVYEFDWFYLRIGAGHYEMNLVKSFFELNWAPFIEKLCEEMGFTSESAKLYAKNCKDHHKSWHLLVVFHLSVLRELAVPYVRDCMDKQIKDINAKGFFAFWDEMYQNKPTLQYLMDQVCRMSQGIINFRMAIRRNNSGLMHSAKFMTKELFYIRNHPKYQQIESYDHLQYILMPPSVKFLSDINISVTTSGKNSSGEDLDFILEEKNRQLKQWVSKGIPTDEVWQTICRNNIILERLKNNAYGLLGLDAGETSPKEVDLDAAVHAFRVVLRKTDYVCNSECHVSVSGQKLDVGLVNCINIAELKRKNLLLKSFLQEEIDEETMIKMPVPVTEEERTKMEDVTNRSLQQLEGMILKAIQQIENPEIRESYERHYYQKVKRSKKSDYIAYLNELKSTLAVNNKEVTVNEQGDTDDDRLPRNCELRQLSSEELEEIKKFISTK